MDTSHRETIDQFPLDTSETSEERERARLLLELVDLSNADVAAGCVVSHEDAFARAERLLEETNPSP